MIGCYDLGTRDKGFWCHLGLHRWSRFESNPTLYHLVGEHVRGEDPASITSLTYMVRRCRRCNRFDLD